MKVYEKFEFAIVDSKYDVTVLGQEDTLEAAIKYGDMAGANSIAGWGYTDEEAFFITNWEPDETGEWHEVETREARTP
jgi:hypothetical protein